jgi:hypothetical protein
MTTLLFSVPVSCLQIWGNDEQWYYVPYKPGALVVNIGETLRLPRQRTQPIRRGTRSERTRSFTRASCSKRGSTLVSRCCCRCRVVGCSNRVVRKLCICPGLQFPIPKRSRSRCSRVSLLIARSEGSCRSQGKPIGNITAVLTRAQTWERIRNKGNVP